MQISEIDNKLLIRLDKGEEILSKLKQVCIDYNITAGKISGIGAVSEVTLGYYHLKTKFYDKKRFDGDYELLTLSGNVSSLDGESFIHIHMSMSDENYQVFGGHLFEANIAVTGEIWILPMDLKVNREKNEEIGLNLMCFGEKI
ncbi:MAG: DNA-binding protein [Candidatus Cloacimonadota bacterium]|nr:MAG: DNA-binding protein [Candidatus Cloacimonadota bacterium]